MNFHTDHLVIGSGIAGLYLALQLARKERVVIIAKGRLRHNNSIYAQGGIASVFSEDDSFEEHVSDTIRAGAGLCHEEVVNEVVRLGPTCIRELIERGVQFSKKDDEHSKYHLTREGGHSKRRVLHAQDVTGRVIVEALIAEVEACKNITVIEDQYVIDLLTSDKYAPDFSTNRCLGAYILDKEADKVYQVRSTYTYLCTGGHGRLYLYTSNPSHATGDGVSMGWRAGCRVANLEFMQFHPTCLFSAKNRNFLISEALRGEGATLLNERGHAFMSDYHTLGSLAPRDVVARAIDDQIKKSDLEHVFLDARSLGIERIKSHFPNIYQTCLEAGIDISKELIPVVPAAHYSCGGLVVNQEGETSVAGLFALGEVACTGLHGANRLASNSLLEAIVYAHKLGNRSFQPVVQPHDFIEKMNLPEWNRFRSSPSREPVILKHYWDDLRRTMWNLVGIVRSDERLLQAYYRIIALRQEIDKYYWQHEVHSEIVELRNLCQTAWLTVRCAMSRKESRGIHYNIDYPDVDDEWSNKDTVLA